MAAILGLVRGRGGGAEGAGPGGETELSGLVRLGPGRLWWVGGCGAAGGGRRDVGFENFELKKAWGLEVFLLPSDEASNRSSFAGMKSC